MGDVSSSWSLSQTVPVLIRNWNEIYQSERCSKNTSETSSAMMSSVLLLVSHFCFHVMLSFSSFFIFLFIWIIFIIPQLLLKELVGIYKPYYDFEILLNWHKLNFKFHKMKADLIHFRLESVEDFITFREGLLKLLEPLRINRKLCLVLGVLLLQDGHLRLSLHCFLQKL